jgi:peptide deformylase
MAEREILVYPKDKNALRDESKPVQFFDRRVRNLIKDLKDTLLVHHEGIGLAAPQIGIHLRVVVVRLGVSNGREYEPEAPIALVNPEMVSHGDACKDFDGCLSFPGLFGETIRPHHLRVSGIDEKGKRFERIFSGFDAVLVHHEIDHLNGVLFIDRIKSLDDLYRVHLDTSGKPIRVPLTQIMQHRKGANRIIEILE